MVVDDLRPERSTIRLGQHEPVFVASTAKPIVTANRNHEEILA